MFILRSTWFGRSTATSLQDQVVGVKGVGALYAAVSWRREMKATVDTFVPTHIKGPFEGRALCDHAVMMVSRGRSGVNTAGQAHIDCNLSPPPSLPPSLPQPLWNPIKGCIIYNTFWQWVWGAFGRKSHTLEHVSVKSSGSSALSGSTSSMMSLISGCLPVEVTAL